MSFLYHIATDKRQEVQTKRAKVPIQVVFERAQQARPPRDFLGAISVRGAVIAELKARTPTIEVFALSDSLMSLASTYEQNGAAAMSIVVDEKHFGTSLVDVARVRETVSLPIIAKDFVVDSYQIVEARAAGADAVLLIARMLDIEGLRELYAVAEELGLSVLVETHSESEIDAALQIGARIIGINNRDLDTMMISLDTTRRLAHLVPDDVVLVAESGIRSRFDVASLGAAGASAFLVGGSLLDAEDPGALLRELVVAAEDSATVRAPKAGS